MARMSPLKKEDVPQLAGLLADLEQTLGFLSNDLMTMVRKPDVLEAFVALMRAINNPNGRISAALKTCISHIAAQTVGCQYCSAHTAEFAVKRGGSAKMEAIWDYERSEHFDEAERAALRFVQSAAVTPNAVDDKDFEELRQYYDDEQIVEILLAICLSAFFTRWNTTMATELEHT